METKQCPACGEDILAAAKKCKHCGQWEDDYIIEDAVNDMRREVDTSAVNGFQLGEYSEQELPFIGVESNDGSGELADKTQTSKQRSSWWYWLLTIAILLIGKLLASAIRYSSGAE